MCTEVGKDDSVSTQMSNIFPQMINIACQNVTEGTDSFDFCEVILQNYFLIIVVIEFCSN